MCKSLIPAHSTATAPACHCQWCSLAEFPSPRCISSALHMPVCMGSMAPPYNQVTQNLTPSKVAKKSKLKTNKEVLLPFKGFCPAHLLVPGPIPFPGHLHKSFRLKDRALGPQAGSPGIPFSAPSRLYSLFWYRPLGPQAGSSEVSSLLQTLAQRTYLPVVPLPTDFTLSPFIRPRHP